MQRRCIEYHGTIEGGFTHAAYLFSYQAICLSVYLFVCRLALMPLHSVFLLTIQFAIQSSKVFVSSGVHPFFNFSFIPHLSFQLFLLLIDKSLLFQSGLFSSQMPEMRVPTELSIFNLRARNQAQMARIIIDLPCTISSKHASSIALNDDNFWYSQSI